MLDERKLRVLYAIIESYTVTAEPVGSKTVSENYDLGVSSATIRNDMGVLEALGFIEKNHSSSGRVPSNKAYRFYVDRILKEHEQDQNLGNDLVRRIVGGSFQEIQDLIDQSVKLLSEITKYTALAVISTSTSALVRSVSISKLDKHLLLLILVFDTNDIAHQTLKVRQDYSRDQIDRLAKILNDISGLKLTSYADEVKAKIGDIKDLDPLLGKIHEILMETIEAREKTQVLYEGLSNIFNYPEYTDTAKAKSFVDLLEDTEQIESLMNQDKGQSLSIQIGEENSDEFLRDITLISSTYGFEGNYGRIGVIGPTRMDYDSVIITILSIAQALRASTGYKKE